MGFDLSVDAFLQRLFTMSPIAPILGLGRTRPKEAILKRTILGLSLAAALLFPTGVVVGAAGSHQPRFTCTSYGSSHDNLAPKDAHDLMRAGWDCVRTN